MFEGAVDVSGAAAGDEFGDVVLLAAEDAEELGGAHGAADEVGEAGFARGAFVGDEKTVGDGADVEVEFAPEVAPEGVLVGGGGGGGKMMAPVGGIFGLEEAAGALVGAGGGEGEVFAQRFALFDEGLSAALGAGFHPENRIGGRETGGETGAGGFGKFGEHVAEENGSSEGIGG